jgi:hypothetical protein
LVKKVVLPPTLSKINQKIVKNKDFFLKNVKKNKNEKK